MESKYHAVHVSAHLSCIFRRLAKGDVDTNAFHASVLDLV